MNALAPLLGAAALSVLVGPVNAQDLQEGAKVFRKCQACHVVDKAQNRVGPTMKGVFGRTAGSIEGFRYSSAMQQAGENGLVWDEETISAYLKDPRGYIKGNRMAFAGLKQDEEIASLLAWLKQATAN